MKKIDALIKTVYPSAYTSVWTVAEPFVGGGGSLLNMAKDFPLWKFHINDNNKDVASFWKLFKFSRDSEFNVLYEMIRNQEVTVESYKKVFYGEHTSNVERAFRVIFLNKTSYNGFITIPRPIGGWGQKSKWGVDVYWNPQGIIRNIERARVILEDRILSATCEDFEIFLSKINSDFTYADPPYIEHGKQWYKCSFGITDLERLRGALSGRQRWCLSMGRIPATENIFEKNNIQGVDVKHTAKSSYKRSRIDQTIASSNEMVIFP